MNQLHGGAETHRYVCKCNVVELFTTWWTLQSTSIDKIHKILVHAPKIQGRVFSEVAEAPQAATTSRTARGGPKPVKMSMISQEISTFGKIVDFSKPQTLNLEKCMIYSGQIEVLKCHYAHVAHIRLSFGCTDEKMDFGI